MNKRDELGSITNSCDADVVALVETWLTAKVRSNEIFMGDKTYEVYRCDREGRHGGGTLVAVSRNIPSFRINVVSQLESVWVCITLKSTKLILGACYRPPDAAPTFIEDLHDVLNTVVCRYPSLPVVLLGDFNFPNIVWSSDGPTLEPFSSQSQGFVELCICFNLTQLVLKPTRCTAQSANILDLF